MYKTRLDITGETYGHLKALEFRGKTKQNQAVWAFECLACGNVIERPSHTVRNGNTRSCGCVTNKMKSLSKTKHGASKSSVYGSYRAMLRRCSDTEDPMFHRYGGRGIAVCSRWLGPDGAANFLADMGEKPSPQHTIERIDNDLGYSPENCRWATRKEQADNRYTTKHITVDGETLSQADWDRALGNGLNVVGDRVRRGWSRDTAVKTPVARHKHNLTCNGRTMSIHAWEIEMGLGHGTIKKRMKDLGWSAEKAITTPSRKRAPLKRTVGALGSAKNLKSL
jgi:hypothetical protein